MQSRTPVSDQDAGVLACPPARHRFPAASRVRAKAEYGRVFADGRRCATPLLALHLLPGGEGARLGLAVSRKADPHAVGRNRIKRVLRDAFRKERARLAPGAYVLVARAAAARADNAALRQAFVQLLLRAGALPAPAPGGTMPAAPPPPTP
ncbi:MAG TPA: ribonuclease P protein component [Thermomonas sp.]|nr:ribonuclease P protein component [Thermomonas sp.]